MANKMMLSLSLSLSVKPADFLQPIFIIIAHRF